MTDFTVRILYSNLDDLLQRSLKRCKKIVSSTNLFFPFFGAGTGKRKYIMCDHSDRKEKNFFPIYQKQLLWQRRVRVRHVYQEMHTMLLANNILLLLDQYLLVLSPLIQGGSIFIYSAFLPPFLLLSICHARLRQQHRAFH